MKLARNATLAIAAAGIVVATGIVGYAAIPGADGQIKGCYAVKNGLAHTRGDTRIVDSSEACRAYERAITWSQKGVKGDTGATGATGATGPQGPAGAPGSTVMWAVLDGDRMELVRGSHAVAFQRAGNTPRGFYLVTFDRDITECAFVGTAGAAQFGNPAGYNVTVGASAGEPTDVLVATRSDFNTTADTSFHLAVFC